MHYDSYQQLPSENTAVSLFVHCHGMMLLMYQTEKSLHSGLISFVGPIVTQADRRRRQRYAVTVVAFFTQFYQVSWRIEVTTSTSQKRQFQ